MPWLAVASAFVPGVFATVVAVIASQTLTTSEQLGVAVQTLQFRGPCRLYAAGPTVIPDPSPSPGRRRPHGP